MPYLRLTDDPPFDIVNDIVDLADQLFEVCAPSVLIRRGSAMINVIALY